MARYRHEPLQAGWITITDMWHVQLGYIDCTGGGAQPIFEELCRAFSRAGWELGERYFDHRSMRRGGTRWEVSITRRDPRQPVQVGSGAGARVGQIAPRLSDIQSQPIVSTCANCYQSSLLWSQFSSAF